MDNEPTDAQVFQEGQTVAQYVESEGWQRVKDKFTEKIMDLQSIKNLTTEKPDELIADIKARNTAIDILVEIMAELEGRADQHKTNTIKPPAKDNIILRD